MKIVSLYFLLVITMLVSYKCDNLFEDMKFQMERQDFNDSLLRIDGYYYLSYGDPEIYNVYFLYKNGIIIYAGGGLASEIEKSFINGTLYPKLMEDKYCWGVFQIDTTSIKFERYYNTDNPSKDAYVRSGTILNDTTFIITKSVRSDGKHESEKNETYHFRQFSPKPDSTNNFIK